MTTTGLLPKLAFVTVAAVGLYISNLGLPLPNSCLRTIAVAGAAPAPSPSCGGDLRECLRLSADLRQTTFGGRYVTAEDVARCMEAFNACIHGGASRGGNASPPTSTAVGGDDKKGLPQHFAIEHSDGTESDCRVSGDEVTCVESYPGSAPAEITGKVIGKLSGLTMTGSLHKHSTVESDGYISEVDYSGPVIYNFKLDGTVTKREGPIQQQFSCSGGCSYAPPAPRTVPAIEIAGTWTAIG